MKIFYLIASLCFFILSSLQVQAFNPEPCGQHAIEIAKKDIRWVTVNRIEIDAPFSNSPAIICAGFSIDQPDLLIYLSFRGELNSDIHPMKKNGQYIKELKLVDNSKGNVKIVGLRKNIIVKIKINKIERKAGKTQYKISLVFLRNILKWFTDPDFREVDLVLSHDLNNEELTTSYNAQSFDVIKLGIGAKLDINKIELTSRRKTIKVNSKTLRRSSSK